LFRFEPLRIGESSRVIGFASPGSDLASSGRPELEYLKAVNSVAPPRDPQLLFLLMAEYSNANRQDGCRVFFRAPECSSLVIA
jgi:hypothetical protein